MRLRECCQFHEKYRICFALIKTSFMQSPEFNHQLEDCEEFLRFSANLFTKDEQAAKELLQETFYRALCNQEKYCTNTDIKNWLYRIMRNIVINNYHRTQKRKSIYNYFNNAMHSSELQPHQIDSISIKEVHRCVSLLPEGFKSPLELHYRGYKYNEIAVMLKKPLGTVKSRIFLARKLLRQMLW
jgi:RNA polymerase sigma factor (sigma-70 family)